MPPFGAVSRKSERGILSKKIYMGQEILFLTNLFDKEYYWMKDGDGTIYLTHVGDDGTPDFS